MSKCKECGVKIGLLQKMGDDLYINHEIYCSKCYYKLEDIKRLERNARLEKKETQEKLIQDQIDKEIKANQEKIGSVENIIATTTDQLEGYDIIEYKGIDFVEMTQGQGAMGDITQIFAGMQAPVTATLGKSANFSGIFGELNIKAYAALLQLAFDKGCNAIVKVNFNYIPTGVMNKFVVVAFGTFVTIEKKK